MKENKIAGIYKITNNITGDFYIGSSKDIKHRWARHRCISEWIQRPNSKLYQAMVHYGLNNFLFEIIEETNSFREREQYFIDLLRPTYNRINANGIDIKKQRKRKREASNKFYENHKEEKLAYKKDYYKSHKEYILAKRKEYSSRLCLYKDETLTLSALIQRLRKCGIERPTQEAKKYIIKA